MIFEGSFGHCEQETNSSGDAGSECMRACTRARVRACMRACMHACTLCMRMHAQYAGRRSTRERYRPDAGSRMPAQGDGTAARKVLAR